MLGREVLRIDARSESIDRPVVCGRRRNASEALLARSRLLKREEAEFGEPRARPLAGLAQRRAGDLADGAGEAAIRRDVAAALPVR